LFSAGVRCNTKLAEEAEIKVEKGIVVDQYLKTSADDVYAAGDVAEFEGKTQGTILAAEQQARIAATNMMGKEKSLYKGIMPSNTLSVEGLELTSMGLITPQGSRYEEVKKINEEKGIYKKIVLDQGKIVGAIILGDSRSVGSIKRLMDLEIDVTKYKDFLLEDNFDFREVLTAPTSSP
jgi:nitrite reductase (NADH) large subunit